MALAALKAGTGTLGAATNLVSGGHRVNQAPDRPASGTQQLLHSA